MSFHNKVLVTFFVYGFVLSLFSYAINFNFSKTSAQEKAAKAAVIYADNLNDTFTKHLDKYSKLLDVIKSSRLTQHYFKTSDSRQIEALFLDLIKTSDDIMQLRYIDNNGKEKIRVDRKNSVSTPVVINETQLQNKKSRYYFKAIDNLQKGNFWFSNLDLNREHGKLELPIKPVIRIGTPLYINDKRVGILIINIFMKKCLEEIVKTDLYKVILIDKEAYTIIDQEKTNNWSRYLDHKKLYDKELNEDIKNIMQTKKYANNNIYARNLDLNNSENLKLILVFPEKILDYNNKINLMSIMFLSFIISLPILYFIAKILSGYKKSADDLIENLYEEIALKELFLSLFESNGSVLFKWKNDESRTLQSVSKSVEMLTKYKQEEFELNRQSYFDCIHKDDVQTVKDELLYAIKYNEYAFTYKPYRIITKYETVKWVSEHTIILHNNHKEIIGYISHIIDITDEKASIK